MAPQTQQELAKSRTNWARQRTLLAKQRTFAAWLRTGLSSMAVGLAVIKLLDDAEDRWITVPLGLILIFVSVLIQLHGFEGYYRAYKLLRREGLHEDALWWLGLVAGGMLIASLLALILVIVH